MTIVHHPLHAKKLKNNPFFYILISKFYLKKIKIGFWGAKVKFSFLGRF